MYLTDFTALFLSLYPNTLFIDFMRYVIGAGGVFLIINLALGHTLRRRKIRSDTPGLSQIAREISTSCRTVLIFAAFGTLIGGGAEAGIVPIYMNVQDFGLPWLVASTLILIIAHDAWFYWTHWLMHRPRLYRAFHRLHHKSFNPTPFTSYSFDASEAVAHALYFPLILLIVPAHPIALLIFTSHMMLRNAIGHCGVEVFPARSDGTPLIPWLTTVTHHDLHHSNARSNFGLYFTWWDKLMGTEDPAYMATFRETVTARRRLTTSL
jgi:sterol desaturase/sphingolipid hydroxylase (fatty acid hydroxylase superfamily)